jgi:hypothetical protein
MMYAQCLIPTLRWHFVQKNLSFLNNNVPFIIDDDGMVFFQGCLAIVD